MSRPRPSRCCPHLGALCVWLACTPHERAQEPSSPCATGMVLVDSDALGALGVPRFCMDVTEVTTAAYGACVRAGVCTAALGGGAGCNLTRADRGDHPINCVSWEQAQGFCAWAGKRLPDDAEWLTAARGPAMADRYPWGSGPPDVTRACWNRKPAGSTCAVGSITGGASPAGLLDMIGNVAEWTRSPDREIGRRGHLRGGSWQDSVYPQPIDERFADSARDETSEAASVASGLRCVTAPNTPVPEIDDSTWTPQVLPPDGVLPVLAAAPVRTAPSRPLANLTVLQRSASPGDSLWPIDGGYLALEVAAAGAIGLTDPLHRPTFPPTLQGFEVQRSLGATVLMSHSAWNERKFVAVEPGTFKVRWQANLKSRSYEQVVAPRTLVVQDYGSESDALVAYALDSGRELWRLAGGDQAPFSRVRRLWSEGERGYVLGERGLAAFDTVTGAVLWSGVAVGTGCGVATAGERVVIEDPVAGHRRIDPETGATLARIARDARVVGPGECMWATGALYGTAAAVIEGDRLLAFDAPSAAGLATLRAFDLQTGAEQWRRTQLAVATLRADHDAVYVERAPELVTALDITSGETRAELGVGSAYTIGVVPGGGAGGPLVIVDADLTGTWILARAEQPAVPEAYTIRGRLVAEGISRKRVANVPVRVGERKVRTDAEGRFEVRGKGLGAVGVALGTDRGPEQGGSRVRFEAVAVVLAGKGRYELPDITLREWELY